MTGIAFHSHGTYATQTAGTMAVVTIPPGTYGTLPTLVFGVSAVWDPSVTFWSDVHVASVLNGLGATVSFPVQHFGAYYWLATMPTGFLDSGATVRVTLTVSVSPLFATYQDAGLVSVVVVSYDPPDVRDGLDHWYETLVFDSGTSPNTGSFSTVPFIGGTYLGNNQNDPGKFGKRVNGDASAILTIGMMLFGATPGGGGTPSLGSWATTNWIDVDAADATLQLLGPSTSNKLYASNAIGLWTKPTPLDTTYRLSCGLLGFGYPNSIVVATLNNDLPFPGGFVYAAIIG
jgi:hypothetical protein